jgi:hypothetical protein
MSFRTDSQERFINVRGFTRMVFSPLKMVSKISPLNLLSVFQSPEKLFFSTKKSRNKNPTL